eukprot:403352639
MANQQLSINQNRIGKLNNIKQLDEISWSLQNSAFVSFNQDGSITPIFRRSEELPISIRQYFEVLIQMMNQIYDESKLEEYRREISPFEELSQEHIIEKIFKICGINYFNFSKLKQHSIGWFDKFRLAFTVDNFLKMNLIYLRLSSKQLVIIMGETGVGKTALIEYLKDVLDWDYRKLNIHEGVTEDQIKQFVQDAQFYIEKQVILFFDEVNTNFNVSGLLKEIMVDRSIEGEKIGDHICIVAACNPYKLKIENQGKGQRNFTSGIKHYRINQLSDNIVYKVHPLPENNYTKDFPDLIIDEAELMKRVLVLTISICYKLSLGSIELRNRYDNKILKVQVEGLQLIQDQLETFLDEEQKRYVNNMEIPLGIGKNDSLKENVFAIITMIRNKIPLFITGKPGTSKTLAMNLVMKSMKGKHSCNEFFRKFPAVQVVNYQGSIQSTSSGIERIFEKAHKFYETHEKKWRELQQKGPSVIIVVLIDEIGLAELSQHNPLKVLHAYLEMFKVGFVGISNWALDDSKRNRGINLSKPEQNENDLKQSALSQFQEICCREKRQQNLLQEKESCCQSYITFRSKILDNLVDFYQRYYKNQPIPNFHGMRDFYQLVCFISHQMKANQDPYTAIAKGVQRNFGGQEIQIVLKQLQEVYSGEEAIMTYKKLQSQVLIQENIQDKFSRNLMVISDYQVTFTLRYIEQICKQNNREFQVFYGSTFEKDKGEQAIYQTIKDIMLCMESGKIVILLNLDNIYQAFYDMLNQNYTVIGGRKKCKVTIGPDSSKCNVDDDFKCILLVNSQNVKRMDAPLLNRFEKHFYDDLQSMSESQSEMVDSLVEWMDKTSKYKHFDAQNMYPVLTFNEQQQRNSLKSLVLHAQALYNQNEEVKESMILDFCKKQIISLANHSGIVRMRLVDEANKDDYCNQFD